MNPKPRPASQKSGSMFVEDIANTTDVSTVMVTEQKQKIEDMKITLGSQPSKRNCNLSVQSGEKQIQLSVNIFSPNNQPTTGQSSCIKQEPVDFYGRQKMPKELLNLSTPASVGRTSSKSRPNLKMYPPNITSVKNTRASLVSPPALTSVNYSQ